MARNDIDPQLLGDSAPGETRSSEKSRKPKARLLVILAALGPGLLAALAGNDAGGISTYSMDGAQFGTAILWIIPVMTIFLIVVQESAGRIAAVTGKGFSALIRETFGVKPTTFAMGALLIANTVVMFSEFAGIAAGMEIFGISRYISVPVAALSVFLLVLGGSYKRVEKILLAVSCIFISYVAAGIMSGPDWTLVLHDTFIPQIPSDSTFIYMVISTIGTTIAPWMVFSASNNVVDKGVTVKELGLQRIDSVTGAIVADLIAWFIILTTATVLFPNGITIESAADAAYALVPIAGQYAGVLFAAGLVSASALAACMLPLTTSYAVCEAFGWERGIGHTWGEAPEFKTLYTAIVVIAAIVVLIPNMNLLFIMLVSQFINGILLPVLLVFLILIINNKHVMGRYVNGRIYNILSWSTVIIVIALTVALLVTMFIGG
jgi:Mn2+/Fe2+ NRAMP family transporter